MEGIKNPTPRIRMLDGFNEGWIEFEKSEAGTQKGKVSLETVLKALVERTRYANPPYPASVLSGR
jgi:NAD(P)H dehydrogenase (quinone)